MRKRERGGDRWATDYYISSMFCENTPSHITQNIKNAFRGGGGACYPANSVTQSRFSRLYFFYIILSVLFFSVVIITELGVILSQHPKQRIKIKISVYKNWKKITFLL